MTVWKHMNKLDINYAVFWDIYDQGRPLNSLKTNNIIVPSIYVYFVSDHFWDSNIHHNKKCSALRETQLSDELIGLLAVNWLPENYDSLELSTPQKRIKSLARRLLFTLEVKNLAAILTLQLRGFSDGMSQDGLRQNAPTYWMRFDIYNNLIKESETPLLHVLDIKEIVSNRNAVYHMWEEHLLILKARNANCNICRWSRHTIPKDYSTICLQIKDTKCKCFQQMLWILKAYVIHTSLKEIAKTAVLVQIIWHLGILVTFFTWKQNQELGHKKTVHCKVVGSLCNRTWIHLTWMQGEDKICG